MNVTEKKYFSYKFDKKTTIKATLSKHTSDELT